MTTTLRTPPGLAGVLVTSTTLSDVRGEEGFYHYRQYDATALARTHTVEEVWFLLTRGHLPSLEEYRKFRAAVGARRVLPDAVKQLLPSLVAVGGEPITVLRSALSLAGAALALPALWDCTPAEKDDTLLTLAAITPTVLAAIRRLQLGDAPIDPDPRLDHCTDYLRMLTGEMPSEQAHDAIRVYLISTMDHGFNASTFTARCVASTGADAAACLVGALGSFTGPLHGGAPSRALAALDEIGTVDRAEGWVREKLAAGERLMGFGHSVYRGVDPRANLLRELSRTLDAARTESGGSLSALAIDVEQVVERVLAEAKPGKPLGANVEYYAGVVMANAGIEPAMFTPTFCVARVIGWAANIAEQCADRKIIRPSAEYVGEQPPAPVPPTVAL